MLAGITMEVELYVSTVSSSNMVLAARCLKYNPSASPTLKANICTIAITRLDTLGADWVAALACVLELHDVCDLAKFKRVVEQHANVLAESIIACIEPAKTAIFILQNWANEPQISSEVLVALERCEATEDILEHSLVAQAQVNILMRNESPKYIRSVQRLGLSKKGQRTCGARGFTNIIQTSSMNDGRWLQAFTPRHR